MGVDAELYASAAASRGQAEPQLDIIKQTPAHSGGSTTTGENTEQNGRVNLGTRQEGGFVVCELFCAVVNITIVFVVSSANFYAFVE